MTLSLTFDHRVVDGRARRAVLRPAATGRRESGGLAAGLSVTARCRSLHLPPGNRRDQTGLASSAVAGYDSFRVPTFPYARATLMSKRPHRSSNRRRARWFGWATLAVGSLAAVFMLHVLSNNADSSDKAGRDSSPPTATAARPRSRRDRRQARHGLPRGRLQDRPAHQRLRGHEEAAGAHREALRGPRGQGRATRSSPHEAATAKKPVEMANLIVSYHPDRSPPRHPLLALRHPPASPTRSPNPRRWTEPFVSANDGGSGVALLMELGHHMKDLEDRTSASISSSSTARSTSSTRSEDEYFFGSKHFAAEVRRTARTVQYTGRHPARHDRRQGRDVPHRAELVPQGGQAVQGSLGHRRRAEVRRVPGAS